MTTKPNAIRAVPGGEIRYDTRGAVDDVVIADCTLFRMERMDTGSWWICVTTADGTPVTFDLYSPRAIKANWREAGDD